ncbi:MAG: ABC transporter ATP-binding protein [Acidimicrobiales bacterium]
MTALPAIDIVGLTKVFDRSGQRLVALDGLDLRVDAGEFVSLIGPSGCGKSTLLRAVCGLLPVDRGSILIGSESPTEAKQRKHFGFVPQTPALLEWKNVRDNVRLLQQVNGRSGDPADVDALIERVGLTAAANAMPRELSGGMQQRVSLARAFALRAPVLIMDEPFSALDEITRADMRYLLLELWRETQATVLFVTHNIDEAIVLSDRVVVLAGQPGTVVADERITLGRPRAEGIEDDPRFHAHASSIRRALHDGHR